MRKTSKPPKRLSQEPANNCFSRFDTSAGLEPIRDEGPKWQNYRKARRLLVKGGKAANKGEAQSEREARKKNISRFLPNRTFCFIPGAQLHICAQCFP